jgi:hypothetical protein
MSNRTLIFSLRNLRKDVYRCFDYEFEDVIAEIDEADFYLPELKYQSLHLSYFTELASRKTLGIPWNPAFKLPKIEHNYEIFFAMLMFSFDLEVLLRMPDWRKNVGYSICYIDELFVASLTQYSSFLGVLRKFDCIVLNCSGTHHTLAKEFSLNSIVVSSGINTLRFFPGITNTSRPIDIYNMGRRDEIVHEQFQILKNDHDWLYQYDTVRFKEFIDFKEHRKYLASIMKRSRFFVVNPAKFDVPNDTGGQEELGFRYFEGAAAGNVMIGRIPNNPHYNEHFPCDEAVVEIPEDVSQIVDFMRDLSRDTDRLNRISYDNVKTALSLHDFVYRWEDILNRCGIEVLEGVEIRKQKIDHLSYQWVRRKAERTKTFR